LQNIVVYRIDTKQQTLEKVEDSGLEDYEMLHGVILR
jgi:hypothetical protein